MSNLELYSKIPELAEASFYGSLTSQQQQSLDELLQDEVLAYEYHDYLQFLLELQNFGSRSRVKKTIAHLRQQNRSNWHRLNKFVSKNRHALDYISRAAILLGIVAASFLIMNNRVSQSEEKITELGRKIHKIDHQQKVQAADQKERPKNRGNYSGTAFAINSQGLFLTTNHVVQNADSIFVISGDNEYLRAELVSSNPKQDIAILKVQDDDFSLGDNFPYTIRTSDVGLSSDVYTLSFSKNDKVYNRGYVSSLTGFRGDTTFYQLYLPASEGSSGSPVIDDNNNIIGFVSSKNNSQPDVTYAVKMKYVQDLIHSNEEISNNTILQLNRKSHKKNLKNQINNLNDYIVNVRVFKP